ncbi:hypothetical protein CUMW_152280 [Citrus unshiu]|uniref:Uncharacterized protein n=1 Tax=Citrus unshiu TaxID=55188 RepID=A0A2H5PNE8_CITUN|nr:hypothetical protein CUMW_152280 [Citrus unshiu]
MHLVSSWLNISLDVVQGTDQTHQSFWARNFESERDEKSLMQRWSKIQQATNKFHNYFSQIENRQQSGVNEQDKTPINLDENDNGDTNFVDLERPFGKKSEKRKIREKKF